MDYGLSCRRPCFAFLLTTLAAIGLSGNGLQAQQPSSFEGLMNQAAPDLWWRFDSSDFAEHVSGMMPSGVGGQPQISAVGPAAPDYPLFAKSNPALVVDGRSWIALDDPGDDSVFDFKTGDSLSIEAWVRVDSVVEGQQTYVIGKGRLGRKGFQKDNQGFALRVRGMSGYAHPSLLFHSGGDEGEFHRWNSDRGFEPDGQWHHIAVSFTFGDADSGQAWVDGFPSGGTWDMGKATADRAPIADNDEVRIGSSAGNGFVGGIDELALFRRRLTDEEVAARFRTTLQPTQIAELSNQEIPDGSVVCDIREHVSTEDPWSREGSRVTTQWQQPVAALPFVPRKYSRDALITDRTTPYVLRMRCRAEIVPGEWQVLVRARSQTRLLIDGVEVATLAPMKRNASGHESVPELAATVHEFMHPLPPGDQETLQKFSFEGHEPHLFEFETVIGGKGVRLEAGESLIALAREGDEFQLLSATDVTTGIDERSWRDYSAVQQDFVRSVEQQERLRQGTATARYWERRHEQARLLLDQSGSSETISSSQQIDQHIQRHLKASDLTAPPVSDDLAFLRRLSLATVGVIPSAEEIRWFRQLPRATSREAAVDRYLNDDRWADLWVPYWQDVLAENPGILKPELNNTGPFRWWIYESFLDNKPMDRFATELAMMKGSRLGGGPAGFSMATQNDVPMASRALVLSTAFNGREMKCARCHDSPVREYQQQELFQLAALLNRGSLKVPPTSSVPRGPDGERNAAVTVSIEPGAVIAPKWPFADDSKSGHEDWQALIRNAADPREQFALHLTHPTRSPFAKVIVNRLWGKLFGRGLVEDPDDWSYADSEYTDLLDKLADQHIRSGYDLKSTARLILLTEAWQRQSVPKGSPLANASAAPVRQRLTAEQMVDSLYAAVGKDFNSEMLTLDPEGRRPASTFLNLGVPTRAWQFCSLSNERDRPALALPVAQGLIDLLSVFGWRDARPHAQSIREQDATVLQSLTVSNGNAGHRLIQLSDGAITTEMCVQAETAEQLTRDLFLQLLSRDPDQEELHWFSQELAIGFSERLVPGAKIRTQPRIYRNAVSWSNHLNAEATRIKLQLEEDARAGDISTERLVDEWRERAEDVIWVLLNSPEFAFRP